MVYLFIVAKYEYFSIFIYIAISYEQYDSLCVSQDETSVERNSVTPQPESIDRNVLPSLPETIDQNVLPPTFEIESSGATNVICDTDDAENRKRRR